MTRKSFYNSLDGMTTDGFFDINKMRWPQKGQKLLKEPTSATPPEAKVCVTWLLSRREEYTMASAFKDGADQLVQAVLAGGDGNHPDRFIFPILYLYRHATEGCLKVLLRHAIEIELVPESEKATVVLRSHALYPLWSLVKEAFVQMWPDGDKNEYSAVEGMIAQLHEADPSGHHLRYAQSIDGRPTTVKLPEWIDIENLRDVFDGLWRLLSGSYDAFDEALSCSREMACAPESEVHPEYSGEYGP